MQPTASRTTGGIHLLLAVPTLGFSLAATTVGTYLPVVVAGENGSPTAIAALIAVEGVMALFIPVVVGARSDRLVTPIGGRLPFVLAGTPIMALALVLVGFQDRIVPALAIVIVLFAAYYTAYEPYRTLYPDLVEAREAGRSQSAQAVARGVGTALALVGGGLLLAIAEPVPFVTAAGILLVTTAAFVWTLLRREQDRLQQEPGDAMRATAAFREVGRLLRRRPALRAFFVANALWEAALGAIRTFVVLWVTTGLGLSLVATSGVIGAAGVCVLLGAAVAGLLAERFGMHRVVRVTAVTYGAPMVVPLLFDDPALLVPMIPVISASAGIMMALPYAMLIPMMPRAGHGLLTGLYSMSRGAGIVLGPLLAGVAIEVQRELGTPLGTVPYSALWFVAGAMLLASVPLVGRMRAERRA
ncbi:MAG TPA: MFS transporter [Miltoncostaea sp.]|nr:MFS transporter [Miltoncostaea sp.]